MKIGIIGPSKLKNEKEISKIAKIIADSGNEVVLTADKNSSSEYFAQEYIKNNGKKVYSILPLDDKDFGYSWVNTNLGEKINCGTWENQPERLDKESQVLVSIGHAVGGIIEMCYTKWFKLKDKKKPIYVIIDIDNEKLPSVMEKELDIRYISINELRDILM
ncbi:MAG: hypothetical protein WCX73_00710 [Candidatus Pacearchaeota archaeon]|jgi:hypothetical protein